MNSPQRKILKKRTRELANISNATDLHRFHSRSVAKVRGENGDQREPRESDRGN